MIVTLLIEVINVHEKHASMCFSNVTESKYNQPNKLYVLYLSE